LTARTRGSAAVGAAASGVATTAVADAATHVGLTAVARRILVVAVLEVRAATHRALTARTRSGAAVRAAARVAATAAVARTGVGVGLATVVAAGVAVPTPRRALRIAAAVHAVVRGGAVAFANETRPAAATVGLVGRQVGRAPVFGATARIPRAGTFGHTDTGGATRRARIRSTADSVARAAVLYVGHDVRLATVGQAALAIPPITLTSVEDAFAGLAVGVGVSELLRTV